MQEYFAGKDADDSILRHFVVIEFAPNMIKFQ